MCHPQPKPPAPPAWAMMPPSNSLQLLDETFSVTSHTRSALRTHNPKSQLSLQVCSRRGSVLWRLKQHLDYMG
ncbi:lysis system o-spanin lipoprotein Rz1 [Escherichia coli]|uniref:lysis system o-spanin lipoprotein Rz1 n=1 Tax=Escherichia coli TaxID=562 RepID=UPI0039BD65DE